MNDQGAKTARTLLIADHLWEAFSSMAAEMGSERDLLINQALYTFARLNGFLVASDLAKLGVVPRAALTDSGRLRIAPTAEDTHEMAAGGMSMRVGNGAAPPFEDETADGAATSLDLPNVGGGLRTRAAIVSAQQRGPAQAGAVGRTLVLLADDGHELERVRKDRFLIGRGKHCDLVINSGKVSREHAAIVREGNSWFIEDLGSSNGTWFDKRRLTRREIHEGDEYYVCAEKLRCTFS
jgi:hypothetical protein